MSLPSLSDGQYKIFNVKFPTEDADLWRGKPTAIVGGYDMDAESYNMVWNLKNDGSSFTLSSAAESAKGAYASVNQTLPGTVVRGSPNATKWTLLQVPQTEYYHIIASESNTGAATPLNWALAGVDTEIVLALLNAADTSQQWEFEEQAEKVGVTARGLDDLD